ncbi:PREDICTED: uncharacterized protein LOC106815679 [Priapulus caudatus]|uniref:Uncharacterized protein LOC106815679 n=1 Tax=Priapulus caudatus TaxID=37621 RepID=A0ABM1ETZ5_PRICU|nr:PREDICTED: uncharacterized protein LOC106815679 [Priapulus caudatus]
MLTRAYDVLEQWTALTERVSLNYDNDPSVVSDAIAREKWNASFFNRLRQSSEEHQRYEVCGQLFGKLTVAREPERTLLLRGVRRHSWGICDWTTYYRYMSHCGYLEYRLRICDFALRTDTYTEIN